MTSECHLVGHPGLKARYVTPLPSCAEAYHQSPWLESSIGNIIDLGSMRAFARSHSLSTQLRAHLTRDFATSAARMALLDEKSTIRMKSGHEIPMLGYGKSTSTCHFNAFDGASWHVDVDFANTRKGVYQT